MTIRTRILGGSLAIVLIIAIFHVFAISTAQRAVDAFQALSASALPTRNALDALQLSGMRVVASTAELGLLRKLAGQDAALQAATEEEALISQGMVGLDNALARYSQLVAGSRPDQGHGIEPLRKSVAALKHSSRAFTDALENAPPAELLALKEKLELAERAFITEVEVILQEQAGEASGLSEQVRATAARLSVYGGMAMLAIVVTVLLAAYRLNTQVARPLARLTRAAQEVAADSSARPAMPEGRPDEIGALSRAFNRMLAKIQEANAALASKVAEQARELDSTQEQLLQSQKMDAFGKLAGGVAHEFNNLLTAILGFAQMARRDAGNPATVEPCLEEVVSAAEQAATLTRQMLAFARKQVLETDQVSVGSVLSSTQSMIKPLLGETLALKRTVEDPEAHILVDAAQLSQAILNLVVNGAHAMKHQGELVLGSFVVERAELRKRLPDACADRYVAIFVRDSGAGIPEDQQKQIFEPFFTTKPAGQGTGLGLSMVYGLVKQSDGLIELKSRVGEGSTFYLYFPLVPPPVADEAALPVAADCTLLAGKKILVAEDQAPIMKLATHSLEQQGYRVITATNGEDALAAYREQGGHVDLLLTDVVMPKKGGLQLARELRVLQPGLKVVFMSGNLSHDAQVSGALEQEPYFLAKPFLPEQLEETVREALGAC